MRGHTYHEDLEISITEQEIHDKLGAGQDWRLQLASSPPSLRDFAVNALIQARLDDRSDDTIHDLCTGYMAATYTIEDLQRKVTGLQEQLNELLAHQPDSKTSLEFESGH